MKKINQRREEKVKQKFSFLHKKSLKTFAMICNVANTAFATQYLEDIDTQYLEDIDFELDFELHFELIFELYLLSLLWSVSFFFVDRHASILEGGWEGVNYHKKFCPRRGKKQFEHSKTHEKYLLTKKAKRAQSPTSSLAESKWTP